MKYFLDTEFLEGTQRTWWGGKTKPTIDLISLALVAEDGREYYAISKDFNLKEAWNRDWIRKNVLLPIYKEFVHGDERNMIPFSYNSMRYLLRMYGESNAQIAENVKKFVSGEIDESKCQCQERVTCYYCEQQLNAQVDDNITFYGYYCDYDWVVFCWLFGKMIDLPKGFPMYCRDLKQMLDEYCEDNGFPRFPIDSALSERLDLIKTWDNYPKQTNEHNALADAKWNMELYNFIQNI